MTMAQKEWKKITNNSNLKYYRGNIIYRATYNRKMFRYPIFKIEKTHFNEKMIAILRDDKLYNWEEVVNQIDKKSAEVNVAFKTLSAEIQKGDTIKIQDIDNYLVMGGNVPNVSVQEGLIAQFEEWIINYNEEKRQNIKKRGQEVQEKGLLAGSKDFRSCLNLLKDFEYDNYLTYPITLKDIDDNFIAELLDYCYDERISDDNHTYLTKGNLVNKTIQKRFDSLFQFLNSITNNRLPNGISKPRLDVVDREIIRLEKDEIAILRNLELSDYQEQIVRDYFLFLCFTGLRFADFYKLNRTYYNEQENYIKLKSNKTFADCQIPLHAAAKDIADKYGWNFHEYTNQGLNRALHTLFEKYNLFEEEITMEYMQSGRKTYTKKKRELITCHSGRRTFISRLIEDGADIHDVMSCTGHKKYDTLKFYVDKFGRERQKRLKSMIDNL